MLDVSLDLTKYFIVRGIAFIVGFLGTLFLTNLDYKKRKKIGKLNFSYFFLSFLLSLVVGGILFTIAMYGVFDGVLQYFPK